ncbi:hypothetical protein HID58_050471, partial [Brassica napus]
PDQCLINCLTSKQRYIKILTKFNNLNTTLIGNNIDFKRKLTFTGQSRLIIDFYGTIITVTGVTNASHSATSHNVINRFFPGWMV